MAGDPTRKARSMPVQEGNDATPIKLLAVDDRRANLTALAAILRDPTYELVTATSGQEALQLTLRESFGVILLDVVMPGMDGFEVARHLKSVERTREIPILFLTAVATDVTQIYRAYAVGAVDYLIKPLDPEVVRRKVAVFVDLVRQRQKIERQARALRETERRQHELEVAELRLAGDRRYRKLVQGIEHAIGWTADETLRLTFVSRQASDILGYSSAQLLDPEFWSKQLHPEDRDAVLATFRRALDESIDLKCDHRLLASEGRTVWFHTVVSGERDAPDAPPALHGLSVDISDLKHAEEQAQRATNAREALLAIVAHDLRSPLAAVRAGADLLETAGAHVDVPKIAQTIIRATSRMERLISDLLDFALIQDGRMRVEPEVMDAANVLHETIELFEPVAAEQGARLDAQVSDALWVHGDRDRILQVIANLVSNAVKFTGRDGVVTIRAEPSGHDALFSVSDTGPGMTAEALAAIWDRDRQQGPRAKGSFGLGLQIARGLVDAHGGRLWAESQPGVGTTFYFTIPLARPTFVPREDAASVR